MRYYIPEPPNFRFFRKKQDCQKVTVPAVVDLGREAPKSKEELRQEKEARQAAAQAAAARPNAGAHRFLDQMEAVHRWWTTPLADSSSAKTSLTARPAASAQKEKPLEPFDLQDVPDAEQATGYKLSPALIRQWFSNPAYMAQSKEQKECLPGAPFYPATHVNATTLKLAELIKTERVQLAIEKITSPEFLNSKPVRDALYKVCSRLPAGYGFTVDPELEFGGNLQKMHRRYAFASIKVGKHFLRDLEDIRVQDLNKSDLDADELALALGEFRVYAAIDYARVIYLGRTVRRVHIRQIAVYIMAPYGFDTLDQGASYMGHFSKKRFALVTDGDWVKEPVYFGHDMYAKNAVLRPVSKPLFIQWRAKHKKGGDMLLFSDRHPSFPFKDIDVPMEASPAGTLYWGGAGLDGPYIQPTLDALRNAGISNVYVGLTNSASQVGGRLGTFVDALRAGLVIRYEDDGEWRLTSGMNTGEGQFNLIGYSYGSLLAAQTANYYAKQGFTIDHLVLIGSPIDDGFLRKLKANPNIKQVVVINLTAERDDIYAGMPQALLLNPALIEKIGEDMLAGKGDGHFYYGHRVPGLEARLKALAEYIASKGVR